MVVYLVIGLVWALFRHFFVIPKRMLTEGYLELNNRMKEDIGQDAASSITNLAMVMMFVCNVFIWPLTVLVAIINIIRK